MNRHKNRLLRVVLPAIVVSIAATASVVEAGQLFAPTGSLSTPRYGHSATRLADGTVLVAGGNNWFASPNELAATEICDPSTGVFSAGPMMLAPRVSHTATLLADNRVLLVGGQTSWGVITNSAELYNPVNGTFTAAGNLSVARLGHTATLLADGRVLIAGGL